MKKTAVVAGLFVVLFLGFMVTAQARTRYSFGFSFSVGPAVPYYGYPAYPPPYYTDYYAYPYHYYDSYSPSYRTYVVLRYYRNDRYRDYDFRSYRDRRDGDRGDRREGRANERSRSGRWRY
jgi:hypothetical protein